MAVTQCIKGHSVENFFEVSPQVSLNMFIKHKKKYVMTKQEDKH